MPQREAEREHTMSENKPVLSQESPPDSPIYPGSSVRMNWHPILEELKNNPGSWMRLTHMYRSERSARASLYAQAQRYGFQYRVTNASPQDDGRVGVFIRWPEGNQ